MADLKALLFHEDGSDPTLIDVIQHQGQLWLVPEWLVDPELRRRRPARIILMQRLRFQNVGFLGADFLLLDPVPRAILTGQTPPEKALPHVVILEPDIVLTLPLSSGSLQ